MVLSSRITGQLGNNKKGFPYFITKKNIFFYQKTENMIYCIEVNRSGIGEENITLHHKFEKEPTREEVLKVIKDADCGYDDNYCKFTCYLVG